MKQIIRKVLKDDIHMKLTHIGLEKLIRDMDKSSNRISFSMIVSSILLSSAIMHATGVGPKIYGHVHSRPVLVFRLCLFARDLAYYLYNTLRKTVSHSISE